MSDNKSPLVSMIVVCYNQAQFVRETLDSVKAQTYANTELIIIDDCSIDDSVAVIERWLQEIGTAATFIRHEKNMGISRTVNDALSRASGKYIAMVASDDLWLLDKIERQVGIMEAQPERVALVYTQAFQIDEMGRDLPGMYTGASWDLPQMPQGDVLESLLQGWCILPQTALIRRSCYDRVGDYDENLPFDDWDMCIRMARCYEFAYSARPSAKYRVHQNSFSRHDAKRMARNLLTVSLKHFRSDDLTDHQRAILVGTMLRFAKILSRFSDRRTSEALFSLWRATGNGTALRAYGVGLFFWIFSAARGIARTHLWFPVLNATRPIRRPMGLNQNSLRGLLRRRQ